MHHDSESTAEDPRPIEPISAGIDIGTEAIYISVKGQPVVNFATFTEDLIDAAGYLRRHGVTTAVMEATGVLWLPLMEILESFGIDPYLVNGAHARGIGGRKSDVQDCQWLDHLYRSGLLRRCFIPEESFRQLRTYVRLRDDHIGLAATHVQHMHKALELMNLKLHNVISQIQGVSGMRIIKAIIAGERDAGKLAALCDKRIRTNKHDAVVRSLQGFYKPEHVFALRQAVECWEFYHQQIAACDHAIERILEEMTAELPPAPPPTHPPKPIRHHRPDIDNLDEKIVRLSHGRDATQLPGLTALTVMQTISEVGTDMTRWPNEKHFSAWAGLAPRRYASGKRKRDRRPKTHNRVGQIFRESAQSIAASKHLALRGFYYRIRAKAGPKVAIVATARKIAELFYRTMRYGIEYAEQGLEKYDAQYRAQQIRSLEKRARQLGLTLTDVSA